NLTTPPLLSENLSPTTCGLNNGSIDLTVFPSNGNSFAWSNGSASEDLQNLEAGIYSVIVTDLNGCTVKADFSIPDSDPLELVIDADLSSLTQGATVVCSLQLSIPLAAIQTITWLPYDLLSCHDPLCLEQTFTFTEKTQIQATAADTNGCVGVAYLLLDVNKEFEVFIPNVFTPNNDGNNDLFTVYGNEEIEEVVILQIFDRWGNMVFQNGLFPPNEENYGWDGIFSDQLMNPAVFAYRAVVRYSNGEEHSFKGDVTLVR
ncbi:MAG TPA: gliding motility-associated C-terminal domain-containing protein, partial [Saprospiraceae bacterium]|nr:gliding motility-associated C-terminal domain-containing protein [Saprospiraceae bacterium]